MKKRISASKIGTKWPPDEEPVRPSRTRCQTCFGENGTHRKNCPDEFEAVYATPSAPARTNESIPTLARSVVAAMLRRLASVIDPPDGAL